MFQPEVKLEFVRRDFKKIGVTVGGERAAWFDRHAFPAIEGDRDIVAFHHDKKICLIAEAEGASSGQPEQKLYKAIGQAIVGSSSDTPVGWRCFFVVVVHGEAMSKHLRRASALDRLGIARLALATKASGDCWAGDTLLPKLLSGELNVADVGPKLEASA